MYLNTIIIWCDASCGDNIYKLINTFGDIDVSLYGQSGAEISFTHSTTDNEELSYPAEESGEYTIKIYGWENAVNTYGLKVILTDADADTDSDSNTENH